MLCLRSYLTHHWLKPFDGFLFQLSPAESEIFIVYLCRDFWNSSKGAFVSGEIPRGRFDLCPPFGESCCFHFCQPTCLLTVSISAIRRFDKPAFRIFIRVIYLKAVAQERAEGRAIGHTNADCLLELDTNCGQYPLGVVIKRQLLISCTVLL